MARGVRFVIWLLALPAAVVIGLVVALASLNVDDPKDQGPAAIHVYPTPSYWPTSPYSFSPAIPSPRPEISVAPCPAYVPPGGWLYSPPPPPLVPTTRPDGQRVCAEPGGVPPDPGTGPVLASPRP